VRAEAPGEQSGEGEEQGEGDLGQVEHHGGAGGQPLAARPRRRTRRCSRTWSSPSESVSGWRSSAARAFVCSTSTTSSVAGVWKYANSLRNRTLEKK
jgi:hypothetical protein